MKRLVAITLNIVLLLAAACTPAESTTLAPTVVPTEPPAATSSAATPEGVYATQYAGEQATIIARATAAPFPTAQPATVQTGQPSSATAWRDGLILELRLATDAYLAGEASLAEVSLRNNGLEPVFVRGDLGAFSTALLDARGHEPPAWPWPPLCYPRPPLCYPRPPYLVPLEPGQAITETVAFQLPLLAAPEIPSYAFWVETRFSRPSPANAESADNLWLRLEAGPIPLQVLEPAPDQFLYATLDADHAGWALRVTDAAGQAPPGPLRGGYEAATANSLRTGPLPESAGGAWSGTWDQEGFGQGQIIVHAWVAAPGYVTAAVTQTVPGTGDAAQMLTTGSGPQTHAYATLEAAQAALDIPLYYPADLPAGAVPVSVEVESSADRDARWVTVRQVYQLPDGAWLELAQFYTNQQYESAGWGQARYDFEAQGVSVNQAPAYLTQRFGGWVLDWRIGETAMSPQRMGFELRAPVAALSPAQLGAIAAGVRALPPPGG